MTPTKFVPAESMPKPNVRVPNEKVLSTRWIRVDLSETKPKKPTHPVGKKQNKPQWFCHFCDGAGHTCPIISSCKQPNKKCLCKKHKMPWHLFMNW